jgi:hypothetical protein
LFSLRYKSWRCLVKFPPWPRPRITVARPC